MRLNETMQLEGIISRKGELYQAFEDVCQSRSDYQLEHFVVGQHESPERRYLQIVIEIQRKVSTLRRAEIGLRQANAKKEGHLIAGEADEAELVALEIEDSEFAILGAMREFNVLYSMYSASVKYTAADLQRAEQSYWETRLARQASLDLEATGRIGVGNLDALRQAEMLPGLEQKVANLQVTLKNPGEPGGRRALVP